MYNAPNVPDWGWIDITDVFDYLYDFLVNLWEWSGDNGLIFHGQTVSWRNILLMGLVVAVMLRRVPIARRDSSIASSLSES